MSESHRLFTTIDLSQVADPECDARLTAEIDRLHASLDLASGPLLHATYFDFGGRRRPRLFVTVHHIAMDGVSWRIFCEDLETAYRPSSQDSAPPLPPKTTSFQQWASRLVGHAASQMLTEEAAFWLSQTPVTVLPRDFPEGSNDVASQQVVTVTLSPKDTLTLLYEASAFHNVQITDILLTALVQTLIRWTGETAVTIDMEGHGREALFDDVDLSRTIGWFTSLYPVTFAFDMNVPQRQALRDIHQQVRRVPNKGLGYGLLRYLTGATELRRSLQERPIPEISFNYLGQFDQMLANGSVLAGVVTDLSLACSPRQPRAHLLEVDCLVADGQFRVNWAFSQGVHRASTIEALAMEFMEALRALLADSPLRDPSIAVDPDFPGLDLSKENLDKIVAEAEQISDVRNIASLYPLAPQQNGIFLEHSAASVSGVHIEQEVHTLRGELDIATLERAWQYVVDLHPMLRTAFVWQGQIQIGRAHV